MKHLASSNPKPVMLISSLRFVMIALVSLAAFIGAPGRAAEGIPGRPGMANWREVEKAGGSRLTAKGLNEPLQPSALSLQPLFSGPLIASPPVSASFAALDDDGTQRTPDTQGAVGPNHLMVTLNSQVRIQTRAGGTISTVPLNSFWASLGKTNVLDPRVLFDPFSQRWIFAAINDSGGPAAGLLLAVSQTSDPTGNWNRYFDTGPGKFVFPDRPSVGFNKDRIIVQVDMYSTNDFSFYGATIFAFNKTNLYAGGTGLRTLFSFQDL